MVQRHWSDTPGVLAETCVFTYLIIKVLMVPKQDVSCLVWLRGSSRMNHGGQISILTGLLSLLLNHISP